MAENQRKQPVTLTRQQLYNQVWETPIHRLAVTYGITGTGLAKICKRLNVPCPPRGYWNRKAAGQKVLAYRLPDPKPGTQLDVTIWPSLPPVQKPKPSPELEQKVAQVATKAEVKVSETLTRPHPIVAAWIEDHRRLKREARQHWDPRMRKLSLPCEFTEIEHRRHRILDAFFKAIERQGGKIRENDRHLSAEVMRQQIEFALHEKERQYRRELTAEERTERWSYRRDQKWTQVREPTGKLVFKINTHLPGRLKTEWLETDGCPMESLLPEIVGVFIAAGPLLVERERQEREEAERRRQEERRHYEEQQRKQRDQNQWRRFQILAQKQQEADLARSFLERLRAEPFAPDEVIDGRSVTEWIAWAEQKISDCDLVSEGPAAIFEDLSEVHSWTYTN